MIKRYVKPKAVRVSKNKAVVSCVFCGVLAKKARAAYCKDDAMGDELVGLPGVDDLLHAWMVSGQEKPYGRSILEALTRMSHK